MALVAPGALLTCGALALALCAAPWLATRVCVAPAVQWAALTLLPLHAVAALLWRSPARHRMPPLALAVMMADALGAGVLLGGDLQPLSPGGPVALVVLLMILVTGGRDAVLWGVLVTVLGTGCSLLGQVSALLAIAPLPLPPSALLEVETVFAGVQVSPVADRTFSTTLSIEPNFAGLPACGLTSGLFMPALAIALLAACVGAGVSIGRVRGAQAAMESRPGEVG